MRLIDADALKDCVEKSIAEFGGLYSEDLKTGLRMCVYIAEQQPERKKGKWEEYTRVLIPEPINKWEQAWYCSECGYGDQDCEDGSAWLEWNFCPNCGADMREASND